METKTLHGGVTKLLIAEIFSFVACVMGSFALAYGIITKSVELSVILGMIAFPILLAGAIISLVALAKMRNLNTKLAEAFWFTIGLIGVAVISAVLQAIWPTVFTSTTFEILTYILNISIVFGVVDGVRELCPAVAGIGKVTLIFYTIFQLADIIITWLNPASTIATVLAVLSMVCDFIYGIFYLIFLIKSVAATKE